MNTMFARLIFILLLTIILGTSWAFINTQSAGAQTKQANTPAAKTNDIVPAEDLSDHAAWSGYLQSAEQALTRKNLTEAQFESFDVDAATIVSNAQKHIELMTPEHDQLEQRLNELGPKPKEGEPEESPDIIKLRKTLGADFAKVDGQIKDARQIIVRAQQLKSNALTKRRGDFVKSITSESQSILEPSFWVEFADGFSGLGRSFHLLIKDSMTVIASRFSQSPWKLFALAFGLVLGLLVFLIIQRKTREHFPEPEQDDELARKRTAAWASAKFVRHGVTKSVALFYIYGLFSSLEVMPERFENFEWKIVFSLSVFLIARSLAKVFLDPGNSHSRIVDLSTIAAQRVLRTILIAVALIAFLDVLNFSASLLVFPFEVTLGLSVILTIIGIIAIVRVLLITTRDRAENPPPAYQDTRILRWSYLKFVLWLGALATFLALVFSYVALAEFAVLQLMAGSIVLAILWLVLELIDTNRQSLLNPGVSSPTTAQMARFQSPGMKQVAILGFGLIKILAILITVIALSLPWGYRTNDWLQWLNGAFFGFKIGGLTISLSTILLSGALFLVGYAITRMLQSWLSAQYLPTTNIESGLRNSITTVLGYIGYTLAAMLAISAVGLDLSNLAIVAGALSVGVGFGLQSIVNNFVSGLILLAERPIKVGDWIVTAGGEGTVRKISVRSTEIQTFDRATVVVPNSTLITDPVTNWTHSSKLGRIRIAIGVGYDSDPDQVSDILLKCLSEADGVLKNPNPSVFFLDFGDNALLFEVRGFLSNIENGLGVKSEIRFAILRAMRAANIEIPYPQRDVHIKTETVTAAPKPATRPRKRTTSRVKK